MLDNLYENIGGKIKNWAKWIFIIEAIGAIITGLVLLFTDDDLILYGLLTLVVGPIVAWVGSWILYAFGELVEDVHAIRNKEGTAAEENVSQSQIIDNKPQPKANICQCGKRFYGDTCPNCGRKAIIIQSTKTRDNLRQATQCECGELHYARYCPICGKKAGA